MGWGLDWLGWMGWGSTQILLMWHNPITSFLSRMVRLVGDGGFIDSSWIAGTVTYMKPPSPSPTKAVKRILFGAFWKWNPVKGVQCGHRCDQNPRKWTQTSRIQFHRITRYNGAVNHSMAIEFRFFPSVLSVCFRWKLLFAKCTGFRPRKVAEASRKGSLRGRLRKEDLTLYISEGHL